MKKCIKVILLFVTILSSISTLSSRQIIIQNTGQAQKNNIPICNYTLEISDQQSLLVLDCPPKKQVNMTFTTKYITQNMHFDQYLFQLLPQQGVTTTLPDDILYVSAELNIGIAWSYHIVVDYQNNTYEVVDFIKQYEYSAIVIYIIYAIITLFVLPPKKRYYNNMDSITLYSVLVSIQLSLCQGINVATTLYLYFKQNITHFSNKTTIACIAIVLTILVIIFHIFQKINKFFHLIQQYHISSNKKILLVIFGFSYAIVGMLLLYFNDKTVFIFAYFTSGSIFYMATFVVIKQMKKYFFSFRLILFDCITIAALVVCSTYYPINNFRIFSYYKMVAIYLIIAVLLLNAGILYILVNVVWKQMKQNRLESKKLDEDHSIENKKVRNKKIIQRTQISQMSEENLGEY